MKNYLIHIFCGIFLITSPTFAKPAQRSAFDVQTVDANTASASLSLDGNLLPSIQHTFGESPAPGTSLLGAADVKCVSHIQQNSAEGSGAVCVSGKSLPADATLIKLLKDPTNLKKAEKKKFSKVESVAGLLAFSDPKEWYILHTTGKEIVKLLSNLERGKQYSPAVGGLVKFDELSPAFMVSHRLYQKGFNQASFMLIFDPGTYSVNFIYSGHEGWVASSYISGQNLNQANHHFSLDQAAAWRELTAATVLSGDMRIVDLLVSSMGSSL